MTFCPRSWPSWPIFATRMRGRRPCSSSNCSTSAWASWTVSSSPASALYTPPMVRIWAVYRPKTSSIAADISPTVAIARAASIASASRLVSSVPSEPERAASVRRCSAALVATSSRSARSRSSLASWLARTAALSTRSTSIGSSSSTG